MRSFEQELKLAVRSSLEAGRAIREIYGLEDLGVEIKDDNSPLTKADRAAHAVIMRELAESGLPVLSEEGKSIPYEERSGWSRFWLVDPLDGTKEFISRNGEFTVNIALVQDGIPVAGVVYVPVTDELYFGEGEGGGYYCSSAARLSRSLANMPEECRRLPHEKRHERFRVVGSRSHMNAGTGSFIDNLRKTHPDLEIVQRGSSLKICMVASGEADIYPRFGPTMEWDTAAGDAVARSAGKRLVNPETGQELRYNKESLLNPCFIAR